MKLAASECKEIWQTFHTALRNFTPLVGNKINLFMILTWKYNTNNIVVHTGVRTIAPLIIIPQTNFPWTIPLGLLSSGQLPPRNIGRGKLPPRKLPSWRLSPRNIGSGVIASWIIGPDYCYRKRTPKVIAPWQYPPGNFPRGKLPFRWFAVYIIALPTNSPEENCPRAKLPQG